MSILLVVNVTHSIAFIEDVDGSVVIVAGKQQTRNENAGTKQWTRKNCFLGDTETL